MRIRTLFAALAISTSTIARPGWAAWPNDKPIAVVVGFAPGGGTDSMARKLLPVIQKHLGPDAQFIVVNKPGAAGELALSYVSRAKPDGYTLAVVNMPGFFFVPMMKPSQYRVDDFLLIARVVDDPTLLAVRDDSKLSSLQDLIAASKRDPGSVSMGHNGVGTNGDLAMGLLGRAAGIKVNPIAYKGTAAQRTDLLGAHLDVALVSAGELPELHDGGKGRIRGLAQLTAQRSEVLPQVPTAAEAGLPVLMSSERGFAAPKGTPADVVQRLEQAIAAALKDPAFLDTSTDRKIISFQSGDTWQQTMARLQQTLQPLAAQASIR